MLNVLLAYLCNLQKFRCFIPELQRASVLAGPIIDRPGPVCGPHPYSLLCAPPY